MRVLKRAKGPLCREGPYNGACRMTGRIFSGVIASCAAALLVATASVPAYAYSSAADSKNVRAYAAVRTVSPRPSTVTSAYVVPRPTYPVVQISAPQREPFGPAEINGIRML